MFSARAEAMGLPVLKDIAVRSVFTETQTRKTRIERWQNMEGQVLLEGCSIYQGKHPLLVDDDDYHRRYPGSLRAGITGSQQCKTECGYHGDRLPVIINN